LSERKFNVQRHINTLTALMYNCQYADNDDLVVQVYKEFLRTARQLLSDHKDSIKSKTLLQVIDPKINALLESL